MSKEFPLIYNHPVLEDWYSLLLQFFEKVARRGHCIGRKAATSTDAAIENHLGNDRGGKAGIHVAPIFSPIGKGRDNTFHADDAYAILFIFPWNLNPQIFFFWIVIRSGESSKDAGKSIDWSNLGFLKGQQIFLAKAKLNKLPEYSMW